MPSSISSGVLTLLHTACGAGILAMPYAFKPFGFVFGVLMIIFCGICSVSTLLIQAKVAKYAPDKGAASFFSLTQVIDKNLSVIFDLAIAIKCLGVGISYLIVVGDLLPQIAGSITDHGLLMNRDFHITLVIIFIVTPLCLMKKLNSLRHTSTLAILSVAYLCVLVMVHYFFPTPEMGELKGHVSIGFPHHEPSILTTLPIFVFAYTCHHNMFSVINEQKDGSFKSTKYIPLISTFFACLLYIAIGGCGYLSFGDNIVGNIITLYPHSASSVIGRIAITMLVMLAFPLQCHPARSSIHNILLFFFPNLEEKLSRSEVAASASNPSERTPLVRSISSLEENGIAEEQGSINDVPIEMDNRLFLAITAGIILVSYLVAMSVRSLDKVLSIVGATGSTSISFILPGIFGYMLIGSDGNPLTRQDKIFKKLGLLATLWGFFVMTASLFAAIKLNAKH
ncbi:Vacuolar amino acid transporter 5 [Nakaseomyces bracarensis]|uniref:Vacuolar amino acid transporter 5 n=1 Tax=Nakaseomyces bracarensis TaxID=273131 RepID=A0ABR4P0D2_9SACH